MLTFSITVLSYLAIILVVMPLRKVCIYLATSGLRHSTGSSLWPLGSFIAAKGFSLVAVCRLSCLAECAILVPQVKVEVLVAQSCPTLCNPMDWSPPRSSVHRILQARILETEMGCHSLLQGIFPTQGLNPSLLYLRLPSEL